MNVRGADERARRRSRDPGGSTHTRSNVNHLSIIQVTARSVNGRIGITENRATRVELIRNEVVVESAVAVGVAVVGILSRSDGNFGLVMVRPADLPATHHPT